MHYKAMFYFATGMKYHFITIEGNIGAGKTTLAHLLSRHFNARLVLEAFADNPFLPKFYENPQQFAFPLELFFMAERYKQLKEHYGIGLPFYQMPAVCKSKSPGR
jgi:deoxyadenosine/deoxycytidine kinase